MQSVLVILAMDYPARGMSGGDTSFISNEISTLAQAFDRVYVFSPKAGHEESVEVPANVILHYLDAGLESRSATIRTALRAGLGRVLKLAVQELGAAKPSPRMLPRVARAAVLSVAISSQVTEQITTLAGGASVTVYSFWAANVGYGMASMGPVPAFKAVRLHGFDLYETRNGYLPFRSMIFENADVLLPVSSHGRDYLEATYGAELLGDKVHVARLGTKDHGRGPDPAGEPLRRVVSCSSIIPLKRVDRILKALARWAETECGEIQWVHFGDGPEMKKIRESLNEVPPNLRVSLRGATPNDEVLAFYKETPVDLFMNLSSYEGVPVSIMEAISFGIPVLASDVGGTSEIVSAEAKTGITIDPESSVEEIVCAAKGLVALKGAWDPRRFWKRVASAEPNARALASLLKGGLRGSAGSRQAGY